MKCCTIIIEVVTVAKLINNLKYPSVFRLSEYLRNLWKKKDFHGFYQR